LGDGTNRSGRAPNRARHQRRSFPDRVPLFANTVKAAVARKMDLTETAVREWVR
jgi:hypothetical protein